MAFYGVLLMFSLMISSTSNGPIVEAKLDKIIPIVTVSGKVYCTTEGTLDDPATDHVFPGALVSFQCEENYVQTPLATTLTNESGNFTIMQPIYGLVPPVSYFADNCRIEVLTPLSKCNPELPKEGGMESISLKYVGNSVVHQTFNSSYFVPSGVRYVQFF